MINDEIKILINKYFDGELDRSKEPDLFNLLSRDENSREYFKKLNAIQEAVIQTKEEYPQELEERILFSIEDLSAGSKSSYFFGRRLSAVIAYSFAVILLVFSIFFFVQSRNYEKQLEFSLKEINQKNQMIDLIYNSLPPAEVLSSEKNQIVITAEL